QTCALPILRGPAGVGDAGAAVQPLGGHVGDELGHARRAARPAQLTALLHGHAAGVVAAVFEPFQAFEQDGKRVLAADCTDDAAHGSSLAWIERGGHRREGAFTFSLYFHAPSKDNFSHLSERSISSRIA